MVGLIWKLIDTKGIRKMGRLVDYRKAAHTEDEKVPIGKKRQARNSPDEEARAPRSRGSIQRPRGPEI